MLDLSAPVIMGILNLTPDSFSDGGRFNALDQALGRVDQMLMEGAGIIDLGGESTRPGAAEVSEQEEMDRVMPVLEAIRGHCQSYVSIDTSNVSLMREAVSAGANMINDVRALQRPGAIEFLASVDVDVCLMHMSGQPDSMQQNPEYDDVVAEVSDFLAARIAECESLGLNKKRIIIDPGFGFGKSLAHNLILLNRLKQFETLECPVLAGLSRKSMIGKVLGNEVDDRLNGGLSAAALAVYNGAKIVRTHDVKATSEAVKMVWSVMNESGELNVG